GFNPIEFTMPPAYTYTGLLDVRNKATLKVQSNQSITYDILYDGSTVNFDGSAALSFPVNVNFYNVGSTNDAGASRTMPAGTIYIAGMFSPGSASYAVDAANIVS